MEQCRFCLDWLFVSEFQQHELKCKKELGAACMFCAKWISKKHLSMHEGLCKQQGKPQKVQCESCGTWCMSDLGLARHEKFCKAITRQEQQTRTKCQFCARSFINKELESHESSCTKRKQCRFCPNYFPTSIFHQHEAICREKEVKGNMVEQLLKKQKQSGGTCPYCGESFTTSELPNHELSCVKAKMKLKCRFCLEWFSVSAFLQHEAMCKQTLAMACSICDMSYSKSELKVHEKLCAAKQEKCRFCGNRFLTIDELRSHEQSCINIRRLRNQKTFNTSSNNQTQKGSLNLTNQQESPTLTTESELKMHEESCQKEKYSNCRYCGECFLYSGGMLQQHELKCLQKVAVVCRFCSESVPVTELNMHEQTCKEGNPKDLESFCAPKSKDQGVSFQQCLLCNGWFVPEQFQQHSCKLENVSKSQGLSDSVPQPNINNDGAIVIAPISFGNITPETKIKDEGSCTDAYLPKASDGIDFSNSYDVHGNCYTTETKTDTPVEMNTSTETKIKTETEEICKDETVEETNVICNNSAPLFHTENILVIKPESQPDIPDMGNILVIKPEKESMNPEQCRDGYVTGMASETEARRSFDNITDGSTKHESELS